MPRVGGEEEDSSFLLPFPLHPYLARRTYPGPNLEGLSCRILTIITLSVHRPRLLHDHAAPCTGKTKPDDDPTFDSSTHRQVRMPDPNAFHYQIPEDKEDTAGEGRPHGEGDAGLRAKAEEHEHMAEKQNSPEPAQTASNHDAKPGLKGDPDKFNAAGE